MNPTKQPSNTRPANSLAAQLENACAEIGRLKDELAQKKIGDQAEEMLTRGGEMPTRDDPGFGGHLMRGSRPMADGAEASHPLFRNNAIDMTDDLGILDLLSNMTGY